MSLSNAIVAAEKLFQIIDRESQVNPESRSGIIPKNLKPLIKIEKLHFSYPTREQEVLSKVRKSLYDLVKIYFIYSEYNILKTFYFELNFKWFDDNRKTWSDRSVSR